MFNIFKILLKHILNTYVYKTYFFLLYKTYFFLLLYINIYCLYIYIFFFFFFVMKSIVILYIIHFQNIYVNCRNLQN